MTDRKIYCNVLEGVTFAERCLYELSKVIEGNKVCEDCIFRELKRLKRGIKEGGIKSKPQVRFNHHQGKRKNRKQSSTEGR